MKRTILILAVIFGMMSAMPANAATPEELGIQLRASSWTGGANFVTVDSLPGSTPLQSLNLQILDGKEWIFVLLCFEEGRYDVYQNGQILSYYYLYNDNGTTIYKETKMEDAPHDVLFFEAHGSGPITIVPHGQSAMCIGPPKAPGKIMIGF